MSKADDIFYKEFGLVIVLLVLFAVAMFFLARSVGGAAMERIRNTEAQVAERVAPEAVVRVAGEEAPPAPAPTRVATAAPAPGAAAARSGADVYNGACVACHGTGAAGAPKVGDKAAWEPRAAQGVDVLVQHALNGKGAMPPKGGNAALTEPEIRSAVEHMLEQTGLAAAGAAPAAEASAAAAPAPAAPAPAAPAPAAPATAAAGKPGDEVFNSACMACHMTGAAGAPKVGDKAAWEPRAAQGFATLLQHAVNGKGAMPPKGGNPTLTEGDLGNAIRYMLEQTGVTAGG